MVELVDALASEVSGREAMRVQVPLWAPRFTDRACATDKGLTPPLWWIGKSLAQVAELVDALP
jgi:hypothetical protein